jgi:hypothetical protein
MAGGDERYEVILDTMDPDDQGFRQWLEDKGIQATVVSEQAPNGSGAAVVRYTGTLTKLTLLCGVKFEDVGLVADARKART